MELRADEERKVRNAEREKYKAETQIEQKR